jgi:uncharacterized protein YdbL (DUF1318 family)
MAAAYLLSRSFIRASSAKGELDAAKVALLNAENADRKIGYEAIAKANGKTVDEVSRQAAAINKAKQSKK